MTDISIFDGDNPLRIDRPIRLIELFAGYGSQALALKYLGVPFQHHCISEWAIKSIQAYKDVHFANDGNDYSAPFTDKEIRKWFYGGRISQDYNKPLTDDRIDRMQIVTLRTIFNNMWASNNRGSICLMTADDLNIVDVQDYTYILTYSFPCQDLSLSGLRQGMARGGQTRSGMLWEVERLLFECEEESNLPQVLLMENVPEVVGSKNKDAFSDWIKSLDRLGYRSYWKILNATQYGIPQSRKRCFMVSTLGNYYYDFPDPIGCKIRLKHILEPKVDERYYLSDETVQTFVRATERNKCLGNGFGFTPFSGSEDYAKVVTTKQDRFWTNFINMEKYDELTTADCELEEPGQPT